MTARRTRRVVGGAGLALGVAIAALGVVDLVRSRGASAPSSRPTPAPSASTRATTPPAARPVAAGGTTTRVWGARVLAGGSLPAGTGCEVSATFGHEAERAVDVNLVAACGGEVLYRSTPERAPGREQRSRVTEEPGSRDGAFRYALIHEEHGARTGPRTQIALASYERRGMVWRETMPPFRVELDLDELSDERAGEPWFSATAAAQVKFRAPVVRRGHVAATSGPTHVESDAPCELRIRPMWVAPSYDCRLHVACGAVTLYGLKASGFGTCGVSAGRVATARDDEPSAADGDPQIAVDLAAGTLRVSDLGRAAWSATIALDAER